MSWNRWQGYTNNSDQSNTENCYTKQRLISKQERQDENGNKVITKHNGIYSKTIYNKKSENIIHQTADLFVFYTITVEEGGVEVIKEMIACCTEDFNVRTRKEASKIELSPSSHCKKFTHKIEINNQIKTRTLFFIANGGIYDPKTGTINDILYQPLDDQDVEPVSEVPGAVYPFYAYYVRIPINFSLDSIFVYNNSYYNNIHTYKYRYINGSFELYLSAESRIKSIYGGEGITKTGEAFPAIEYASGDFYTAYSPENCYEIVVNPFVDSESKSSSSTIEQELPSDGVLIPTTSPSTFAPRRCIAYTSTSNSSVSAASPVYYHEFMTTINKTEVVKISSGSFSSSSTTVLKYNQYTTVYQYLIGMSDEEYVSMVVERIRLHPDGPGYSGPRSEPQYARDLVTFAGRIWSTGTTLSTHYWISWWAFAFDEIISTTASSTDTMTSIYTAPPYSISGLTNIIYPLCITHIQSDDLLIHAFGLSNEPNKITKIYKNNTDITKLVVKNIGVPLTDISGMVYLPKYPIPEG